MLVSNYIKHIQGYEEYAFTWDELMNYCQAPEITLRVELLKLAKKNEILNIRQGFYIVIPPKYKNIGKVPIQLYIDKLFNFLQREYYVGFFSASTIHGAAHQQMQKDYVMTVAPPLRDISKNATKIKFIQISNWPKKNILKKNSDAGYFNVSSPALTIADLVHHQNKLGGLNRILANIEELIEVLTIQDINDLLEWYPNKSTLQRVGYLLEELNANEEITTTIYSYLVENKYFPILLNPKTLIKPGSANNRWKIDVNITLENDL